MKAALALGAIPVFAVCGQAGAAQNAGLRAALKYQDSPKGDQKCGACMHFIPGKSAADKGGCKIMPGDTEINPNGWCLSWVVAKK
jgi:hypothetical protein